MTRSFWFGDKPSKEFVEVERVVKDAYEAGLKELTLAGKIHGEGGGKGSGNDSRNGGGSKTKVRARDIDEAARNVVKETGYGPKFIHTTGHGVGLDIHEFPSLNWRNEIEIVPGTVVTIEPGVYLEGKFGYRYENTVVATKTGAEVLT